MIDAQALVKTLDFQPDIQSGNESLLYDATVEARSVYNETIPLLSKAWTRTPFPTAWINTEYMSQRCPLCGHTERANLNKKQSNCKDCGH